MLTLRLSKQDRGKGMTAVFGDEMTKQISLINNQDRFTTVDDDDFSRLSMHKWSLINNVYAGRRQRINERLYIVFMSREILSAPPGLIVDHINGDTLDNRKVNLRLATNRQNNCNRRLNKNNTSGYKGVYFEKDRRKCRARISIDGKMVSLGPFDTVEKAARAYDKAAKENYGEFARLNFPDE